MKSADIRRKLFWCLLIAAVLLSFNVFLFDNQHNEKNLVRLERFEGEIVMYQETDQGLKVFLKDSSLSKYREFLITDQTEWLGTEIDDKVKGKETGIYVRIESKFKIADLENDPYGTYPVFQITPLNR